LNEPSYANVRKLAEFFAVDPLDFFAFEDEAAA
jgi:hypothetical protein